MSARNDFWDSGLPFISDADGKRVDWTDVGLLGLGTVLTSFFESVADLISELWSVLVIDRLRDLSNAYAGYVEGTFGQVTSGIDTSSAVEFAGETGLVGSLVLIAAGGFLIAWAIGVIRDEQ
ncbi:hypothetical protein DJ71_09240 [Halorubrum sp. E3]|uniref:hypothetical protein n=1 Tax=Halorubrum sp. GN12_10-3_MGM TaxID=2518113 RepID=UPI0002B793D0|nr:hypothetical protein [Halorubrum sp. GN12_10-3_MGM]AGF91282.1 hypothetical protein HAPG_00097 [Halorubrum phage GNf2]OYR84224.1 hypothetical protein DJ71_09240 [Halorubrum sp. E3]TKX64189.1 hypothetical protein EXE47_12475 [Halorubrum sp. GN12_10-3_MGM]